MGERSHYFHKPSIGPALSYFGSKYRASRHYPPPRHETIIEPFAGGAGYSLRYHRKNVILVDANPKIAAIWRYLIRAQPMQILALPDVPAEGIHTVGGMTPVEKWLVGFWLNGGVAAPRVKPSRWCREANGNSAGFWGHKCRERLAEMVDKIKHWRVIEGEYSIAPECEATWFIDPPYIDKGKHYPTPFTDFSRLAKWCKARSGQVMVCEQSGARWLPFKPLAKIQTIQSKKGSSDEVVWMNDSGDFGLGSWPCQREDRAEA